MILNKYYPIEVKVDKGTGQEAAADIVMEENVGYGITSHSKGNNSQTPQNVPHYECIY